MVVVAIMGVFFAIAVPSLQPELHKQQLDGAADIVASMLARARSDAMQSKRCTRVWLRTAVQPHQVVLERLNNFDCDISPETLAPASTAVAPAPPNSGIDGSGQVWVLEKVEAMPSKSIQLFIHQLPAAASAMPGLVAGTVPDYDADTEIRFRPNGRIWTQTVGGLDDAVVQVLHNQLASQNSKFVLANSNGLICTLRRGVLPQSASGDEAPPQDFVCPN